MVTISSHGGACCGARHLHSFGSREEERPQLIIAEQAKVDRWRMTEVILNGRQVESSPATLSQLADLGYVLTAHYVNGNHNSDNYVFQRCDNRRPLINARGECVIPGWTGAVITPRLEGQLETIPAVVAGDPERYLRPGLARPVVPFRPTDAAIPMGSRVVWNATRDSGNAHASGHGPDYRPRGSLGTLRRIEGGGDYFYIQWDNPADRCPSGENPTFYVNRCQFTVLTDEEARANPFVDPPADAAFVSRHDEAPDFLAVLGTCGVVAEAREVPAPAVVFATFHNSYRDGRVGAGYNSLDDALGARRGRNGRVLRRDIYSDGTTRMVPVHPEAVG